MTRTSLSLALVLLTVAPLPVSEATPTPRISTTEIKSTPALVSFQKNLSAEGRSLSEHSVYIESLTGNKTLVAFNENISMNPASVIKLATSLAALDALGPDYRFRTEFYGKAPIDRRTGELEGDLLLRSGGDPSFSIPDARAVGDALRSIGVRRVRGNLVVAGPFNCNYNTQTGVSAGVFRRQSRIGFSGTTVFQAPIARIENDTPLLTLESEPLLRIIYYQNAHSVNAMAELLSEKVGGVEGVRRFITRRLGLDDRQLVISRASGLDYNRMSARDTVMLLRAMMEWLGSRGMELSDVMPVAGIDSSTLIDRFDDDRFAGSVIAKTGTLHESDGGVAALAGVAYTRSQGPVLFAIYDMAEGRRVEHLRHLQDDFLMETIDELGGPRPRSYGEDRRQIPAPAGRILVGSRPASGD
jgi:D-alanyl-D-alanine carboxypeptidase/D-alanyl-D-alanine-endopeptidase (penicillin-binding protein 4)